MIKALVKEQSLIYVTADVNSSYGSDNLQIKPQMYTNVNDQRGYYILEIAYVERVNWSFRER